MISLITLSPEELAKKIDNTLLKPSASYSELESFCRNSIKFNFVCCVVPPWFVRRAKDILRKTGLKVATVIGFPLGYQSINTKLSEAKEAIFNGADEIDVVANISAFKSGKYDYVCEELSKLAELAHKNNVVIKVIIETSLLSQNEIIDFSKLLLNCNVDYVKTNTGFMERGVRPSDIILIKSVVGNKLKIKAAGGIRTWQDTLIYIMLGADRIGTSSGINIIKKYMEYLRRKQGINI